MQGSRSSHAYPLGNHLVHAKPVRSDIGRVNTSWPCASRRHIHREYRYCNHGNAISFAKTRGHHSCSLKNLSCAYVQSYVPAIPIRKTSTENSPCEVHNLTYVDIAYLSKIKHAVMELGKVFRYACMGITCARPSREILTVFFTICVFHLASVRVGARF